MPIRPRPALLLAVLLTLAPACSEKDPKALTSEGSRALAAGKDGEALTAFDGALSRLDASNPDYLRAKLGRIQALARKDPTRAKEEFLDLVRSQGARIEEREFGTIIAELLRKGALTQATEVVEAGLRTHPDSKIVAQMRDEVGNAASKSKDPEALQRLKGMGYVGEDG